ncbi:DUF4417 domain-containing protein [Ancylothrix sp. C2]|nr:DUF4417 domain-containing protein [Ancylothrix sp. D3o]
MGLSSFNTHFDFYPLLSPSGMPIIKGIEQPIEGMKLIVYEPKKIKEIDIKSEIYCINGFTDDVRINCLWSYPIESARTIQRIGIAITPDYTLDSTWAEPVNRWQTYRSRWVGAFWESKGIKVIPSVNWCDSKSFEYGFEGILPNTVMAITTNTVFEADFWSFHLGLRKMIEVLHPSKILVVGCKFPELELEFGELIKRYKPHLRLGDRFYFSTSTKA